MCCRECFTQQKIHNHVIQLYISQLLIVPRYRPQVTSDNLFSYIHLSLHNALFILIKMLTSAFIARKSQNNTSIKGYMTTQKVMYHHKI